MYKKFLKKEVALDSETFTSVKEQLTAKFIKEYHCTKHE